MNIQVISIKTQLKHVNHCVHFELDSLKNDDFITHGISFPERLHKAVPKRQAEYLAGRLCAKMALQQAESTLVDVATGEDRAPIWPQGFLGSISHSKGMAMAMVAQSEQCQGLGIDLEHFMTEKQENDLQTHILCAQDRSQFEALAQHVSHPLTLVFSAKESIFKALYSSVKRFFGFEAAALQHFDNSSLTFRITTRLSDLVPEGAQVTVYYQVFDGWLLTECEFQPR
jgi:enterobactin synthetase component D